MMNESNFIEIPTACIQRAWNAFPVKKWSLFKEFYKITVTFDSKNKSVYKIESSTDATMFLLKFS